MGIRTAPKRRTDLYSGAMLRILREPRWIALLIAVPVGVIVCLLLSDWQFNRWEGRKESNSTQERNLSQPTAPIQQVLGNASSVPDSARWRTVSATGEYVPDGQVLVRRRPLNGVNGFWVITPLVTDTGNVLAVNRGWIKAGEQATSTPVVPPPPSEQVSITGRLQPDSGQPATPPDMPKGQAASVNAAELATAIGKPALPGYVDLVSSAPPQAAGLTPIPVPEISEGTHLSYSLQWIAFAIMFIVGLVILIRREVRLRREEASVRSGESATPLGESSKLPQDSAAP